MPGCSPSAARGHLSTGLDPSPQSGPRYRFRGLMRPLPASGSPHPSLADFVGANAHAYTRAELVHFWSRRQLDRGTSDGALTRLLTGVYCGAAHVADPVVRGEALNLWQPGGAVTGASALHLYAPILPRPDRTDLVVPHGRHLTAPSWVRLRQSGPVGSTILASGVATVPMPRALLDAWRFAAPAARRPLLWEALWQNVCTWRQLRNELRRTARVAGRRDLERVLGWFAEGATTPLEVCAKHEAFADPRFGEFEWQAPVTLPTRFTRPDMLHRPTKVAVELEGHRYHSTRTARDADRERRTELTAAGYTVLEFGWNDITRRPEWCREKVLSTVARRRGAS